MMVIFVGRVKARAGVCVWNIGELKMVDVLVTRGSVCNDWKVIFMVYVRITISLHLLQYVVEMQMQ
jgi:hypothetical protein